ncbi:MAG: ComEC/Rec2 family competence protein [Dehalococcoidales bacterium]|nr:ComEC/Rec2 family competence protein [Dehalococcoidales bacterium]
MRIKRLLIILSATTLLLSACVPRGQTPPSSNNLTVHFIDVGQGDAILIDMGDIEVLIDGGEKNTGAADYIRPYVNGSLDVMVATHTHADHIGGLIEILAKYQIKDIWLNGDNATSATFAQFMNSVNAEGAAIHEAERGNTIQAGNITFIVLNPARPLFSDQNNNSIVLSLKYGGIDFLFTGDAEDKAEAAMLLQSVVPIPDIEILKAGHHGSRTASSPDFLNAIRPETAVYSTATSNSYGHPHKETLINLDNIGAKIYGTDVHGTIVITTDGKTYTIQTGKQAPAVKP